MYSRVMQKRDSELIQTMNSTKETYDKQKRLFEETKEQEEELKQQLESQRVTLEGYKVDLENQKSSKEQLLKDTKNDEAEYQRLLNKAKEELDSYAAFVNAAGGGVIGPNGLGGGEDGWYYSQRDSRWANDYIGNSSYTVFHAGCLVTSVSMMHKYYGYSVEPDDIADHDAYFSFGDMRIPWPAPSGRSYALLFWGSNYANGYKEDKIDNELDNGNPVIVGVHAANSAGTHFIVLFDKDDGDYIMHDPYYGPDLNFSDYYNTGLIFEVVAFK